MKGELRVLIPDLVSDEFAVESSAIDRFQALTCKYDADDVIGLIHEAEAHLEERTDDKHCDPREPAQRLLVYATLVAGACSSAAAPAIEHIRRLMPLLNGSMKTSALNVLAEIPTRESFETYVELLEKYGEEIDGLGLYTFSPDMIQGDEGAGAAGVELLQRTLEVAADRHQRDHIYLEMIESLKADRFGAADLTGLEADFLKQLEVEAAPVRKSQRECGPGQHNWKYESPYDDHRNTLGILIDVAGWWGAEVVLDAVEGLDGLTDPHLRLIRATSLIRAGRHIPASELEWLAQWPCERVWLRRQLMEMGKSDDDLPEACRDVVKLAEGHMVDHLSSGEFRREPDEMELVHVEHRDEDFGGDEPTPTDYYLYRFRVTEGHWAEDGWMAGVAGGFYRTPEGELECSEETVSFFTEWEEKTLEEHIASLLDGADEYDDEE